MRAVFSLLPFAFLLSACSALPSTRAQAEGSGVEGRGRTIATYDLGKITVVVYPDADSLIDNLDPIRRMVMESVGGKTYGYVENLASAKPTLHTIDDLSNFLHELKHYLQPEWRHPFPCAGKDGCLEPFVSRRAVR